MGYMARGFIGAALPDNELQHSETEEQRIEALELSEEEKAELNIE
ncbi:MULTISPECIES: hypothetical protein [unclassified Pseudomonas]|jgi:hypothetical protein|nr:MULTISPECIES: hypothetical protein [unclassified Pseudomonas]KVV02558.1 hypothetical protein AP060_03097 [Pseudomonas sp. TAD18]KVV05027.1 hypothetical protein AP059_03080 [Pseudomonas sp. TAA207]